MNIVPQVKIFLEEQFKLHNLTRKSFEAHSKISYRNICHILNSETKNITLINLIRIAHYFNCSIDEVIGRLNYKDTNTSYTYHDLDFVLNSYNKNLHHFLHTKIQEQNLNPYKFAQILGFNAKVIIRFINDNTFQKHLTTPVIVAISDYFDTAIDKMIGRISYS
jgi:plasmid maintenance system antidote protein VapI